MFRKLRWQMTVFFTFITSLILIALTCVCLFFSESSLKNNMEPAFLKEINNIITYLQNQNVISLQWVNQLQENNRYLLFFYDNGTPLFSRQLYSNANADALADTAREYALSHYGIDVASTSSSVLPEHDEFQLTDASGISYYASVGVIHKEKGYLGFIVLCPLAEQQRQILAQRLLFAGVDIVAVFLLTLFAWFFTGRMLVPLKENHRKQIEFVSAASHELRAPLTVMLSGADALEKADTAAERKHFLEMIQTEGIRMQHLISDLLFLARSDSGVFPLASASCQPDLLIMDAYEKFELPARQKKLSLSMSLPEEQLPSCFCDPERIAQVFSILLDNAISYTPEGGKITLSLSMEHRHSMLCFRVSDTGPGVSDAEKGLIFDRFYRSETSHTEKNHFGLGLCIAKEIISAHQGSLWVEDAPEGGAGFVFMLPAA